jgi:hypothetical protein
LIKYFIGRRKARRVVVVQVLYEKLDGAAAAAAAAVAAEKQNEGDKSLLSFLFEFEKLFQDKLHFKF